MGLRHTEDHLATQMMMKAIDEINEKAENIHITGYPNSVLGGSQDLVEGVQAGLVDIITEGPSQFGTMIPKASQVEAPFLYQSVDHMMTALNGEYKNVLNELFDAIGVKIAGTFYYGTRQLTVNKEVHTLADLKGMKIRVPQADMYVKMIEAWDAAPTPMALGDLYLALQTGTVDGQENPSPPTMHRSSMRRTQSTSSSPTTLSAPIWSSSMKRFTTASPTTTRRSLTRQLQTQSHG